jgi:hypothetical protein
MITPNSQLHADPRCIRGFGQVSRLSGGRMIEPYVTIWTDAPELAIPEMPALLSNSQTLWLAYETIAEPRGEVYAVVRFQDVIDHRLSPINDEGIGEHQYAKFGLQWYGFNEIIGSAEVAKWSVLRPRHWVVTFKDGTLDVLAASACVIARDLRATSPLTALLSAITL